jgi:hypothetical protein
MQEYDEAEKLAANLAAVHFNRGVLLHRHKDAADRAVELYRKFIANAGGEVALSAEHPVFGLLREAESILQAQREAQLAEEQARQMEALQARQAEQGDVSNAAGDGAPAPTRPAGAEQKNPSRAQPGEPDDEVF